ncbi:MAG TPA: tRNA (adenosine(37)-N6)-threonylcarbamoyltransferase complex dimerization subunit type 1 TsaB [Solirubrobacteraceae bacterium]|nr:tRNA (adenosine(37)-N6)-threonylcarbamoyltransferase complex dimerization subunit type 1 TsaB [Solirubrobacteraceae bacterium]
MILGLDTATSATAVALLDPATGRSQEARDDPRPGERPRHTTGLMSLVVEKMRAAGVGWEDIRRIAVGVGPGTFTGLRIGVATAQALARARDIPLVGVSTLQSLALGAAAIAGPEENAVIAVIDARRGEVFAAGWSLADVADPRARPLLAPQAVPVEALAERLRGGRERWLAAGDGSVASRAALERSGARIPKDDSKRNRVSAIEHCRLALGLPPEPPDGVRPQYLRLPDAEINLRAARQP